MKRAAQTIAVLVLFGIIAAGGLVFVSNVWSAVDVPDGTDPRAQRDDYDPATARYDCRAYRGKYNFLIRSPECGGAFA